MPGLVPWPLCWHCPKRGRVYRWVRVSRVSTQFGCKYRQYEKSNAKWNCWTQEFDQANTGGFKKTSSICMIFNIYIYMFMNCSRTRVPGLLWNRLIRKRHPTITKSLRSQWVRRRRYELGYAITSNLHFFSLPSRSQANGKQTRIEHLHQASRIYWWYDKDIW